MAYNSEITQLRIDVEKLKVELLFTEKALKLAHDNLIAWIGLAVTATAIIVTIVIKVISK